LALSTVSLILTGPRSAIAVDGLDGSGKSQFATTLVEALRSAGRPATLLHVDDFRRALDFDGLEAAEEASLYYGHCFAFPDAGATLATALAGPPDGSIAVFEGVMVLRAGLPAGTPLVVLNVSPEEARRRIVARDQAKGRTLAEIARRIDHRYFPAHLRYCAAFDPQARADLMIDDEDWTHPRSVWRRHESFAPGVIAVLDGLLGVG